MQRKPGCNTSYELLGKLKADLKHTEHFVVVCHRRWYWWDNLRKNSYFALYLNSAVTKAYAKCQQTFAILKSNWTIQGDATVARPKAANPCIYICAHLWHHPFAPFTILLYFTNCNKSVCKRVFVKKIVFPKTISFITKFIPQTNCYFWK